MVDGYQTTFGPTNVAVHRVAAAVEMGEGPSAVEHHEAISPDALAQLRHERRAASPTYGRRLTAPSAARPSS